MTLVMTCSVAAGKVWREMYRCRTIHKTTPKASNPTVPQTTVIAGFISIRIAHQVRGPFRWFF